MAGTTGLEPATSAVTGQRSNQLNYVPARVLGTDGGQCPIRTDDLPGVNRMVVRSNRTLPTIRAKYPSGDVVQLVRTLPCHGRGRGFESRRPRHSFQALAESLAFRRGNRKEQ